MNIWEALLQGLGQLLALFYDLVPNYGVAIVLLTIVIRLALLPLTVKQTRSMLAMQRLQPEIKKLQAKYKKKEDRMKLQEETMALYKAAGANPLGGCLPLLLQMPILFALFRVLNDCVKKAKSCIPGTTGTKYLPKTSALASAILVGNTGFLGMQLTETPNQALKAGVVHAIPYFVLIALTVLTGLYQQAQIQKMQTAQGPQAAQMALMGKIFPVMFAFFALNFPAGLSVYWVATNIWTIGQQHFIVSKIHAAEALKTKPLPPASESSPNGGPTAKGSEPSGDGPPKGRAKHKGEGAKRKGRRRK